MYRINEALLVKAVQYLTSSEGSFLLNDASLYAYLKFQTKQITVRERKLTSTASIAERPVKERLDPRRVKSGSRIGRLQHCEALFLACFQQCPVQGSRSIIGGARVLQFSSPDMRTILSCENNFVVRFVRSTAVIAALPW